MPFPHCTNHPDQTRRALARERTQQVEVTGKTLYRVIIHTRHFKVLFGVSETPLETCPCLSGPLNILSVACQLWQACNDEPKQLRCRQVSERALSSNPRLHC